MVTLSKSKKAKKLNDRLKEEFQLNTKPIDWCEMLDSSNFIKSVLAPSKYGEEIQTYDDYEVREFCRKHNLHNDEDIILFAIQNTEFTIEGLFGL